MVDETKKVESKEAKEASTREILGKVYEALKERGYHPVNQIIGYLLSEDPTYITNYNGARTLICKVERDELLELMLKDFLGIS